MCNLKITIFFIEKSFRSSRLFTIRDHMLFTLVRSVIECNLFQTNLIFASNLCLVFSLVNKSNRCKCYSFQWALTRNPIHPNLSHNTIPVYNAHSVVFRCQNTNEMKPYNFPFEVEIKLKIHTEI